MCEDEYRLSREDVSLKLFWLFFWTDFWTQQKSETEHLRKHFFDMRLWIEGMGSKFSISKDLPDFSHAQLNGPEWKLGLNSSTKCPLYHP